MNMNFRQVTGNNKFFKWGDWKPEMFAAGKVVGFQPNKKNTKFQDIIIVIEEHNLPMQGLVKGDRFTLNGMTQLEKFINTGVKLGDMVKVVYKGQEIIKTGEWAGSKTHCVEGYVADSSAPDTAQAASALMNKANSVL